jgi:hypothetical protein
MKRLSVVAMVALTLLAVALPAPAESADGGPRLPITRVVLFSSGVGYFQRDGRVDGDAQVALQFPTNDINDLLKSLVVQDVGQGQVSTVSYDNRNPIAMTLKSFALDLTANPSLGDLLNQARGERVEVTVRGASAGQPETLTGVVVGVERQRQIVAKDQVVEVSQLNLLTADGVRGLPLAQVQRVRFLKDELDKEFRKALDVLATAHDKQKKTVTLHFQGQGQRPVRVAYVTESPIWKTSYRVDLRQDKVFLQGWAIVENTTDDDWNKVQLALISGRPISFQMDLYQPLFVPRPVVEPELFASLRPPSYNADLEREGVRKEGAGRAAAEGAPSPPPAAPAQALGAARPMNRRMALGRGAAGKAAPGGGGQPDDDMNLGEGVVSVANAAQLGDYFQYAIKEPITLARQKSALIPIVNQDVAGSRVSIYNENVLAKNPLLGLRFKNNTPLHLSQGPMTVFENSAYAGDARIPDLQPNEMRLLSYAVDLGTEVEAQKQTKDNLMAVKVIKGIVEATFKLRETKTYTVKNRSEHARTVLIEHPFRSEFKLVAPKEPTERSRDVYRFELTAEPNKPAKLEVAEELPRVQQIYLTNSDDEQIRFFLRASAASDAVKRALQQALALKAKVNETQREIQRQDQQLKIIEQDQARMRANMERVPPTSDAYKRYLRKFDDQETDVERRRTEITRLQDRAEQERKAYEEYITGLTVE